MNPYSLSGVGSREVGDDINVQIVDDYGTEPDAWAVLKYDLPATVQEVVDAIGENP
jgi:hypothetical protein